MHVTKRGACAAPALKNYFIAIASFRMRLDYNLSIELKILTDTNLRLVDELHTCDIIIHRYLAADYPLKI
jgi:hypothetical protein